MLQNHKFILWFQDVGIEDVPIVGGKNASLGEMLKNLTPKGVNIPGGFIVAAEGYRHFLKSSKPQLKNKNLKEFIEETLTGLDTKNLKDLTLRAELIRKTIKTAEFPEEIKAGIVAAYKKMEEVYGKNTDVAVRSSATAEDLPGASFAGEHETYLNIRGEKDVIAAVKSAMASLFTARAISYRVDKGFSHFKIALSVGVQKMVRADLGASGVIFTLDTESGFRDVVLINGSWGLGEMIVQGEVTPDEFLVFKSLIDADKTRTDAENSQHKSALSPRMSAFIPIIDKKLGVKNRKMIYSIGSGIKRTKIISTTKKEQEAFVLSEEELLKLAKWSILIEKHYSDKNKHWTPMDLEWAKDGKTGELFIVQARPETVHAGRDFSKIKEFILLEDGRIITKGTSVGSKIASGRANVILDAKDIHKFKQGEVLVTDMTDPDWEPVMKIASAIVTDKGGRTSHAAIVSRELGIPCIVGTENATRKIKTGEIITIDTAGTEGIVYSGALKFKVVEHDVKEFLKPETKIMLNIATPDTAFEKSFLPNDGVGLAREEFIIAGSIGIHPNLILDFEKIKKRNFQFPISNFQINSKNQKPKTKTAQQKLRNLICKVEQRTVGYKDKTQFYVDKLAYGIAKIGAAFYPKPVIVRFSDFKTNEYRTLLGGEFYEPNEENPMLGWRGASRYYHPNFIFAFALECKAIKKVRDEIGLVNVIVMIPFCRTPEEGRKVLEIMAKHGLSRETAENSTENYTRGGLYSSASGPRSSALSPRESALKIYVMCEIPSNIILADEFLDIFDGMSIGSNDLTQLTVGIDRDAGELVRGISNENDGSVKKLIAEIIKKCLAKKKYIGICGQAPSDMPEFAEFLVEQGIQSISLNPDTVVQTTLKIYEKEQKQKLVKVEK